MDVDVVLGALYDLIAPHLTKKQRRLLAGAAARALGHGGGARMARISGLSRSASHPTSRGWRRSPADRPPRTRTG